MSSDQITKQIKFAVVMYGGGSLAIYINGVAQELLKMVQATRADIKAETLTGTSVVYRKIAHLLSKNKTFDEIVPLEKQIADTAKRIADVTDLLSKPNELNDFQPLNSLKAELQDFQAQRTEKLLQRISVRFVIDVLTGSSAGGINAIFLSKALAHGANMDELRDLWMTQGDFSVLLNDKKSVRDNSLLSPREPKSLLNSQRMYLELLKALHGMDEQSVKSESVKSESMDDVLDLFVTFTDFQGVPLPISISNKRILERRHKQVFNFRFDRVDKIDDFEPEHNPFLAFAARSTSAFPLAFEPMKLTDIDEVLDASGLNYQDKSNSERWKPYFRDVVDETGKQLDWINRSFVDGGALDNKPFSYAIDTLAQREATGFVERKLLFIDPSPEEFAPENPTDKPDALENLVGQATALPRYETIREDVERLKKRNSIINRVNRITAQMEEDFDEHGKKEETPAKTPWAEAGLKEILEFKGPAFLLYYRLRITSVTDQITRMASGHLRIDEESKYASVVRCLISFWRDENYKKDMTPGKETLNNFLYLFDVDYRFRRLRFVMQKLEFLMNCHEKVFDELRKKITADKRSKTEASDSDPEKSMTSSEYSVMYKKGLMTPSTALYEAFPYENEDKKENNDAYKDKALAFLERLKDKNELEKFIGELMSVQKTVTDTYSRLRREDNYVQERVKNSKLGERLTATENYKTIRGKLADLKSKFDDVEHVLRLFEIDKQIADAKKDTSSENPESRDKTLESLENLKKTLLKANTPESELPDDEKAALKPLSDDEKAALKRLSLDALERINKELKKRDIEKRRGNDCGPTPENSYDSLLGEIFGQASQEKILNVLNAAGASLNRLYGRSDDASRIVAGTAGGDIKTLPGATGDKAATEDDASSERIFLGAASHNMKALLGITDNNNAKDVKDLKEELKKTAPNPDYSYFIRAYLRNYYLLFDSYDQLSFPIYFETSVGEAVDVEIVRVSSRDAISLINEGKEGKGGRRKLAGDYLFAFGAFLDARWRQNDIMWGRLDGAERLIGTLLPGDEYEKERLELIREANETILSETLLQNASDTFNDTVSKALAYAGVEAIDNQPAAARLFKGLERETINSLLLTALKQKRTPSSICDDIKNGYEVDRVLEPEPTLQIISRATQIGGKILENIADEKAQAGNRLRWIARLGSIFWGLVTVAAPSSMANLLFNYWLQLIYLFEVVLIVGATILPNPAVQQFGMIALVLTVVLNLTVLTLHDLMREKNFLHLPLAFAVVFGAISAALGAVFIYAFVFDLEFWKQLVNWKAALEDGRWSGYQKLLFIAVAGIFVLGLFGWREAKNRHIWSLGLVILFFTIAMAVSAGAMEYAVSGLPQKPLRPVLALEFADSKPALKEIVAPTQEHITKKAAELAGKEITDLQKPDPASKAEAENVLNLRSAFLIDSFVFIPLYALTFLLLAQLLAFRRTGGFSEKTFFFLLEFSRWRKYLDDKDKEKVKIEPSGKKVDPPAPLKWREKAVSFAIFHTVRLWRKLWKKDQPDVPEFPVKPSFPFQKNSFWLACIAVSIILAAAAADGVENYFSYLALVTYLDPAASDHWYIWKTNAAYLKFVLIFAGVFILSFNFYRAGARGWLPLLFILSILLSLIGISLLALGYIFTVNALENLSVVLLIFIAAEFIIAVTLMKLDQRFLDEF